jgi:hypothetical protein
LTLSVTCFLIIFLSSVEHVPKHCPTARLRPSTSQVVLGIWWPLAPTIDTPPLKIFRGGNSFRLDTFHDDLENIHEAFSKQLVGFQALSHIRIKVHQDVIVVLYPKAAIIDFRLNKVILGLAVKDQSFPHSGR